LRSRRDENRIKEALDRSRQNFTHHAATITLGYFKAIPCHALPASPCPRQPRHATIGITPEAVKIGASPSASADQFSMHGFSLQPMFSNSLAALDSAAL